ncbi:hypothetical protein [Blastococcus sp. TF02A-35]|uniref:hypothetical protein n=1 Tax=Blastococcus sp. TF02A-35 TaxID=2559612 RepID=UPI001074900A|nr:hypothetical protein [Blastococcus sp. TF02A_35]TFV48156.1 hypothetical protein E4P43_14360 [Blastococcus sp. TF02A_35]
MGTGTTTGARAATRRPGTTRRALVLLAALLTTGGCASGSGEDPASPAASADAPAQYDYSPAGFQECLDDRGVRYREDDQGSLSLVDQTDPEAQGAADECQQLTTRPVADGESARINRISQAIIDCLGARDYHVKGETSGHFVDGTPALGYSVPQAEQESPTFKDDLGECTRLAEEANPEK